MLVAQLIEYGFVLPLEPPGPETTPDGQFRLLRLAGIDQHVQFFRVRLTDADGGSHREVFVVSAHHPALSDEAVASTAAVLLQHFADRVLVFTRQFSEGWARATCMDPKSSELAAAAVATVMAVAAWDESNPIVIEVDGHEFDVVMAWSDKRWIARVQSRSS